jgi:shikimate kinase
MKYMKDLEKIRESISRCDDQIIGALAERMNYIEDIITYKKQHGMPILQPEQEKHQEEVLESKLRDNPFKEEIKDIFSYIVKNSRRIQARSLFRHNIFLVGFMGAGKTTVSKYLGSMLALERVEIDELIVQKEGMSINSIFEEYGEEYFRNCESNTLIELQKKNQLVVSCGGGIVLRGENIASMKKNGCVVLLTATPETTLERVKDSDERPILKNNMNVAFIEGLMEKRREKYLKAADIIVKTDGKTVLEVCEEIVGRLADLD